MRAGSTAPRRTERAWRQHDIPLRSITFHCVTLRSMTSHRIASHRVASHHIASHFQVRRRDQREPRGCRARSRERRRGRGGARISSLSHHTTSPSHHATSPSLVVACFPLSPRDKRGGEDEEELCVCACARAERMHREDDRERSGDDGGVAIEELSLAASPLSRFKKTRKQNKQKNV